MSAQEAKPQDLSYRFVVTHNVSITVHEYRARGRRIILANGGRRALAVCRIEYTTHWDGVRRVKWHAAEDAEEMEYVRPYRLLDRLIDETVGTALNLDPVDEESDTP